MTPRTLAAVDLGSNSFHLLVARWDGQHLHVLDESKETVRLAAGLQDDRSLAEDARERALEALRLFRNRIGYLDAADVRAVATNTLRAARDGEDFAEQAAEALGHEIEIIDGSEEARLIHLGVAHDIAPIDGARLVVDIGGGSTEVVLGHGLEATLCHSLRMGCVAYGQGFFRGGKITEDRWQAAVFAASNELAPIRAGLDEQGWNQAVGASGTIRAVADVIAANGWGDDGITPKALARARDAVLEAGDADALDLDGLSERRRSVFAPGLAILFAVFDALSIERMHVSQYALREGVVYDLIGRQEGLDLRERTVELLQARFGVDAVHAARVQQRAETLLGEASGPWKLDDARWRRALGWALRLHEVGLAIRYGGHHKHGAYIVGESTLPGFSRREQRIVAALILCHRRKFRDGELREAARRDAKSALRVAALLRLAVRLERSRGTSPPPTPRLSVDGDEIRLAFPPGIEAHPLVLADLEDERERLEAVGFRLRVETVRAA